MPTGTLNVRPDFRTPAVSAAHVELELLFPVLNREGTVRDLLRRAGSALARLDAVTAIGVIDNGSSDRTAEAVDEVAADSPVPIRLTGCSTPGWGSAAYRGTVTSRARWVGFAEEHLFGGSPATAVRALSAMVAPLRSGYHVVVSRPDGELPDRRALWGLSRSAAATTVKVFERQTAQLLFSEAPPRSAAFFPVIPNVPRTTGVRMFVAGASTL